MSEGKRPGGLTALAVLNFVFGGVNALLFLGMAAVMAVIGAAANEAGESDNEGANEMAKAWETVGVGLFYFILVLLAVTAFLLIASGVGYLQQKKVLGRGLGNAYAILSILYALVYGMAVTVEAGGGFNIGTIISLVYPLLTLVLLNTTFKHDFTR
ncbi:MAG TPA: hypothetical protein EYP98_13800 [Planctomycetes bacterium]|nr:hypothetical protein [Planctomycetota bacterium]